MALCSGNSKTNLDPSHHLYPVNRQALCSGRHIIYIRHRAGQTCWPHATQSFCHHSFYLPSFCLPSFCFHFFCLPSFCLHSFCLLSFCLPSFCLPYFCLSSFCLHSFCLHSFCLPSFCLHSFCLHSFRLAVFRMTDVTWCHKPFLNQNFHFWKWHVFIFVFQSSAQVWPSTEWTEQLWTLSCWQERCNFCLKIFKKGKYFKPVGAGIKYLAGGKRWLLKMHNNSKVLKVANIIKLQLLQQTKWS